ncbi:trans-aconitate 2-methyltransferase [Plakobranchus ocellatus]|uniref:Trans-aconitate 2-methyltransferase n=1 Tax=Plakobranchus ocellatus TaxID=259542 RepID=A0AAV4B594_9GAST|nr:trans-aconitate 2-methyltransferase [Plakobranchus ocellatus]
MSTESSLRVSATKFNSESKSDAESLSKVSFLFVGQKESNEYAVTRHSYSEEVFQIISNYCRESIQDLNLAVDVGCGPGNSTVGFTKHFKQVIGVDISETQIALAPNNIPNCQFKVGSATNLDFLQAGSVDLVASGLAFNLMPQEETLAEFDRVLRPGGTLAIFGYSIPTATDPKLHGLLQKAFIEDLTVLPKQLAMVYEEYKNLEIPYPGWVRRDGLKVKFMTSMDGLLGAYKVLDRWLGGNKEGGNIEGHRLRQLRENLAAAFPDSYKHSSRGDFETVFNVFILMGHKPKP